MFPKNSLTTNKNKTLLKEVDVNFGFTSYESRVNSSNASALRNSLCSSSQGEFSISQNNQNQYVQFSTKRKKTDSEKSANKMQSKSIKQIISNILDVVKEKFVILKFAGNKPKKRDFTLEDLTIIQNLVDKNNGDFPKSWAQFYKLTGTNPETFNN